MEVSLVLWVVCVGSQSSNDIGEQAIIDDEATGVTLSSGDYRIEIDKRFVDLVVVPFTGHSNLHKLHTWNRHRSFIDGIHRLGIRRCDFKKQCRFVANDLETVDVAIRHLDQESFRCNDRLRLSFNRESNLSVLDYPPGSVVWMKLPRRLRAGCHLNVVRVQEIVADNRFFPAGLALVRSEKL